MPINGNVDAIEYDYCIENMEVGDEAYIHVDEIVVTKKAIFVAKLAPVITDDEMGKNIFNFVPIRRIGFDLTERDFELDFSQDNGYDLKVDSNCVYISLMKENKDYIIFRIFKIGQNKKKEVKSVEEILEDLNNQINLAVEKDDFPKAAELRDKVKRIKSNKKDN